MISSVFFYHCWHSNNHIAHLSTFPVRHSFTEGLSTINNATVEIYMGCVFYNFVMELLGDLLSRRNIMSSLRVRPILTTSLKRYLCKANQTYEGDVQDVREPIIYVTFTPALFPLSFRRKCISGIALLPQTSLLQLTLMLKKCPFFCPE